MSNTVILKDRKFKKFISEEKIQSLVKTLAERLKENYTEKNPILISVLDGSFVFTADLIRHLDFEHELVFVKLKSYFGTKSSGEVQVLLPLEQKIEGREVIIIEDIVDTGTTLFEFIKMLNQNNPKSISICSLLLKPLALSYKLPLDHIGTEIGNDFVIGYGLDVDGAGRNLRDIYILES